MARLTVLILATASKAKQCWYTPKCRLHTTVSVGDEERSDFRSIDYGERMPMAEPWIRKRTQG